MVAPESALCSTQERWWAVAAILSFREFYRRLLAAGKLKKVALTAFMQKLLTVLNSMMRTGEHLDPTINMS